ncbi:hypothetical protein HYS50_01905 [Candidatus Woesearchaeota archaeon]|nr:hypothetical protein [Candidatus Woesearchaeota archaeon]
MPSTRPELPIDKIDLAEFNRFKKECLDAKILNDETLKKIREDLFGLTDRLIARPCDEYHAHHYGCVDFNHPAAAVIDRLVEEIGMYKQILNEINEKIKEGLY